MFSSTVSEKERGSVFEFWLLLIPCIANSMCWWQNASSIWNPRYFLNTQNYHWNILRAASICISVTRARICSCIIVSAPKKISGWRNFHAEVPKKNPRCYSKFPRCCSKISALIFLSLLQLLHISLLSKTMPKISSAALSNR